MEPDEYERLQALPIVLTIHRGCRPHNKRSLGWTLSYEKAAWFARRFGVKGLVLTGQVLKKKVIALYLQRDEQEIVVEPRFVKITEEKPL